jgi:phosphatidylglycerophosphate synthase/choline kinase
LRGDNYVNSYSWDFNLKILKNISGAMKNKIDDFMEKGQFEIQTISNNFLDEMSEERNFGDIGVKCIILVSNEKGNHLKEKNLLPLTRLFEIPLIERTIFSAKKAGIEDFVIVLMKEDISFQNQMDKLSEKAKIKITSIYLNETDRELNLSFLNDQNNGLDSILLIKANYYIDFQIFEKLVKNHHKNNSVLLAIDRGINDFNLDYLETTNKVLMDDQNCIKKFGHNLTEYNALVPEILFFSSEFLVNYGRDIVIDNDFSLNKIIEDIQSFNLIQTVEISREKWIKVEERSSMKRAEKLILKNLVKPTDGFISRYFIRKMSVNFLTPFILKINRKITPNQVTVLSLIIALISSGFFFFGNAIAGAIFIQLANTIDHSDGEIARLKHRQSPFGDFLDAVFDRTADIFVYLGILNYLIFEIANKVIIGIYWSSTMIIITCVLALAGNVMVSYTSTKAMINMNYSFNGRFFGTGQGRDTRLFLVFIGGLLTFFHPIFLLFSMLIIAILTSSIVIHRTFVVWNYFKPNRGLVKQ